MLFEKSTPVIHTSLRSIDEKPDNGITDKVKKLEA